LEDFLLDDRLQLALGVVYLECGSDGDNFSVDFAQACAVCCFVPEFWPEAYELLFDVGEQVSARVFDPEGVSDGEYFLVDDVLCSSEGCVPSGSLADGLWVCGLEGYRCSAASTETAAWDEWLAA
jgi:hypothetical protein